jgi:hypothetical protein
MMFRRMMFRRILLSALLAVSLPSLAGAGAMIMVKESARFNSTSKLYLSKGNLRIEAIEDQRVLIYRAADDSFWKLDPAAKTYQDMGAMAGPGVAGAPKAPEATYKKVASGEVVNGFATDQYEVTAGGEKIADVWMARTETVGLDPADVAGFRLLAKRMESARVPPRGFALSANAPEGVPMRTIAYYKGQTISINELSGVTRWTVEPALFELPADYKPDTRKP